MKRQTTADNLRCPADLSFTPNFDSESLSYSFNALLPQPALFNYIYAKTGQTQLEAAITEINRLVAEVGALQEALQHTRQEQDQTAQLLRQRTGKWNNHRA